MIFYREGRKFSLPTGQDPYKEKKPFLCGEKKKALQGARFLMFRFLEGGEGCTCLWFRSGEGRKGRNAGFANGSICATYYDR